MAKRITQKQLKHDEFVDAAVDFGQWLEENWSTVVKWAAAAVIVVLAVVGWRAYAAHSLRQAKERLAQAITRYEQAQAQSFANPEDLSAALETFQEVGRRSGRSAPARVARYYEGVALYRLGRFDEAAAALEPLAAASDGTDTLGATAEILLARVHVASGRVDVAIEQLRTLSERTDSVIPADRALLELGRVQMQAGMAEDARSSWQRIVDEHPLTVSAAEARSLLQ